MCVSVFLWMHIYILTYTYTLRQIQSHWLHFFIKNKSFKAVYAYKFSLFLCTALDCQVPQRFTFARNTYCVQVIHICIYIYVGVNTHIFIHIHTYTHAIYLNLNSTCCKDDAKGEKKRLHSNQWWEEKWVRE